MSYKLNKSKSTQNWTIVAQQMTLVYKMLRSYKKVGWFEEGLGFV